MAEVLRPHERVHHQPTTPRVTTPAMTGASIVEPTIAVTEAKHLGSLAVVVRPAVVAIFGIGAMSVPGGASASVWTAHVERLAERHEADTAVESADVGKQKPKKKGAKNKGAKKNKLIRTADDDASDTSAGDTESEPADDQLADTSPEPEEQTEPDADLDAESDASFELDDDVEKKSKRSRRNKRDKASRPVADMRGRLGIGAVRTVSGLNGLTARYYLRDRFTVGLVGGVALFTHGETGDDGEFDERRTVGLMGVGTDLFFWPVQGDRSNQIYADVGLGLRSLLYLGFDRLTGEDEDDDDTIDRPMEIDVEIPVAIQLFVGPNVAFVPEFGAVVRIIPGSREADQQGNVDDNPGTGIGETLGTTNGPGLGLELGSHAGMFIGLGVFYYFGAR